VENYSALLERIAAQPAGRPVVVEPYVGDVLEALAAVGDWAHVSPVLVGDKARIEEQLDVSTLDAGRVQVVHADSSAAAASEAAARVAGGEADYVVKGSIASADLLKGLLGRERLGPGRVASHLYVIEAPAYDGKTVAFADAGVNIAPDLATKADIVRNSAEALRALGTDRPRLAVLSAVELVKPGLPSSVDAALLTVMARRGQLGDVEVDGPLSLDAALSVEAAGNKSLGGLVAGHADILLAPDIDAANMASKAIIGATGRAMGVVLGARVPIALPSRGDSLQTRVDSLLLASYLASRRATARS
jgi:phosphotransacetylase